MALLSEFIVIQDTIEHNTPNSQVLWKKVFETPVSAKGNATLILMIKSEHCKEMTVEVNNKHIGDITCSQKSPNEQEWTTHVLNINSGFLHKGDNELLILCKSSAMGNCSKEEYDLALRKAVCFFQTSN